MRFSIPKFLSDFGFKFKTNGSGTHYVLDECPSCKKSGKFYINIKSGKFVCHRCAADTETGMKGGIVNLVSKLGNVTKEVAYKMIYNREKTEDEVKTSHQARKFIISNEVFIDEKIDASPIKIPSVFRKIKETDIEAWKYLTVNRGLTKDDIEKSEVMVADIQNKNSLYEELQKFYGTDENGRKEAYFYSNFVGRIIFPVRKNGRIFGMVARDYSGKRDKNNKVLNSKGTFRHEVVWNLSRVLESNTIVVCEGIIDAIKCGIHRSIATFGVNISVDQLLELYRLDRNAEVIVVSDPGFEKESRENARLLANHFYSVRVLEFKDLPVDNPKAGRDAGDRTHEEMNQLITDIKKDPPFDFRKIPKLKPRKNETRKFTKKRSNQFYRKARY